MSGQPDDSDFTADESEKIFKLMHKLDALFNGYSTKIVILTVGLLLVNQGNNLAQLELAKVLAKVAAEGDADAKTKPN